MPNGTMISFGHQMGQTQDNMDEASKEGEGKS